MKKILLIILVLFSIIGCSQTQKQKKHDTTSVPPGSLSQPGITEKMPITTQKTITIQSVPLKKDKLPVTLKEPYKNTWHYSIFDPMTKEIEFYDRNNNILWRTFRY